jgi:KUP system potassium uptake protein
MPDKVSPAKGIIKSLGLVFGDIGTSPIYTLTVIILLTKPTETNIFGVLSLIVWTLIILVTVGPVMAMRRSFLHWSVI